MIVQCDQCSTRFKLDDSKVRDGGVKVRCSKCKHVFVVQKEISREGAAFDAVLAGVSEGETGGAPHLSTATEKTSVDQTQSASLFQTTPSSPDLATQPPRDESPAAPSEQEGGGGVPESFSDFGFEFGETPFSSETAPAREESPAPPSETEATSSGALDFDTVAFEGGSTSTEEPVPAGKAPSGFPDFDFGDTGGGTPPVSSAQGQELGGDSAEFSPPAGEATGLGAVERAGSRLDFALSQGRADASSDFFADAAHTDARGEISPPFADFSFDVEAETSAGAKAPEGDARAAKEVSPLAFEDIDFGETAAPPLRRAVSPEMSSGDQPAAPPAVEAPSKAEENFAFVPSAPEDELPPLAISSRRRGRSLLPIAVIALSVLLVLGLASGGLYILKEGPSAFNHLGLGFMARWFGLENGDEGGVAIRNLAGSFVENKDAGELFVVTGEAVNNFRKPRAFIQVKGSVFGKGGGTLLQRTAYCGNTLTTEQLKTLPMVELDKVMSDQFGASMANLGIDPGKAIPFVIVFRNIPRDAGEYGVEVVGSTVANK